MFFERSTMQKITPFLWFNSNAEEAVSLYTSIVPNSSIGQVSRYGKEGYDVHHMREGTAMTISFVLGGLSFTALNGGPNPITPNPSISFHIKCASAEEVDAIWNKLLPGGTVLMELGSYPFSKRYGWVQDAYGFSWQVICVENQPLTQKITPVLMYTGTNAGRAEEAMKFYISLFENSKITMISRYGKGMEPDTENSISYGSFTLDGIEFGAMDSAHPHAFTFNEAISLSVACSNQEEVDRLWSRITENGGKESMCGWAVDTFGVSWQITPMRLMELMSDPDKEKAGRVMNAMLTMKKIDIATIESAANA